MGYFNLEIEWINEFAKNMNDFAIPFLIVLTAVAGIYAIVLGVKIGVSDGTDQRSKAINSMSRLIISIVSIVILSVVFFSTANYLGSGKPLLWLQQNPIFGSQSTDDDYTNIQLNLYPQEEDQHGVNRYKTIIEIPNDLKNREHWIEASKSLERIFLPYELKEGNVSTYIFETDINLLEEMCYKNNIDSGIDILKNDVFGSNTSFGTAIKRVLDKLNESNSLEDNLYENEIFDLKINTINIYTLNEYIYLIKNNENINNFYRISLYISISQNIKINNLQLVLSW